MSLVEGCWITRKLLKQGLLVFKLKSSLRNLTVATMTWLTVAEYLCHKWPRIYSVCRNHYLILSSFMTCYRVCKLLTRVTRRMPHVELELLALPEHLISHSVLVWCVLPNLVFCVMFCRSLFVLFLVAIVLSVFLWFTVSDYPFSIFKLFLQATRVKFWV
jgi:hypothetical protein